jgi:hypothetical protein
VRVEGTVYDAATSAPLGGVGLAGIETDAQGRFAVDVDAGVCSGVPDCDRTILLTAEKTGYAPLQWQATVREAANLDDVVLRLVPLGGVAGRLFGPRGEQLPGVRIIPFRFAYSDAGVLQRLNFTTARPIVSNDLGEYRIGSLPPGDYFVEFMPEPIEMQGMFLMPLYYPGDTDRGRTEPISISSGETTRVRDVVFFAVPARTLRLHLENQTGESLAGNVALSILRSGTTRIPFATRRVLLSGDVATTELRLPPGGYDVIATASNRSSGMATVRLDAVSTETRISLRSLVPATFAGSVVADEPARQRPVSGVQLGFIAMYSDRLAILDPPEPIIITSQQDGSFSETRLPSGQYRLRLLGVPSGAYIARVLADGREVGTTITFEPGSTVDLTVVLADSPASIEGIVRDETGNGATAIVVLIPEATENAVNLRTVETDALGRFNLEVAPGSYRAYAWSSIDGAPYYDPAFLNQFVSRELIAEPGSGVSFALEVLR